MLALRLTRVARPAVQLRRLLVTLASAGTSFLLLSCLGYALNRPEAAGAAALRLAWCGVPLAATVYFALAVARTDPATQPRPGLSAVGLGPARLMAVSALTTALSCTLGSTLALLAFLHLRGDLTALPFDGGAGDFLATAQPLPVPAALTLLGLVPAVASTTVALALCPRDPRPASPGTRRYGRFGAYGQSATRETFGAYGRFGARLKSAVRPARAGANRAPAVPDAAAGPEISVADTAPVPESSAQGTGLTEDVAEEGQSASPPPVGLPWGIALLAAGLAVHAYAGRTTPPPAPSLSALSGGAVAVLVGWLLTTAGLVLAAPGLTRLCGQVLQSVRPGALRLLAGRVLMAEAVRIGRPLGVVCAVASAAYAVTAFHEPSAPSSGPLATLGALVVAGCTVATLLTAAVEARQCRADTTAALLRLGAPAMMLRGAAALRVTALLAVFGPLTLVVAALATLPLTR
ncbi:hypothetical protein LK07_25645 [Streptomyces pluripotens]|uniref:Uncharacterized protein n=1 Tax=Streptomyces pluripotens TaxID=1355015 RepID=A0A221P4X0_9ACTN|nr:MULTISPECIES: hypothetical protein [Streptomyces]ARP72589.1 hypothetical protein LK06_024475 [Streptomyces pluripotens]ASN26845.1 hypothetical protein LK07_25645 [Streptomyces pluripotens]KIE23768.1 membrane protein [Streptomyces sp. MUSC 125]MCH0559631.1 hypothetical protein [Streptomyces sp. MUM 16J]